MKAISNIVTQGAADAYAQAEISTGLANVTNRCFRIRRIEWFMVALASADSNLQLSLCGRSLAAFDLFDNATLAAIWKQVELTTSGSPVYELYPNGVNYDRDMDLLIVEESLFLQVDSNGTGAANTCGIRIWVEDRTITTTERLSIQAARLA